MSRRTIAVLLTTALAAGLLALGASAPAQAGRCDGSAPTVPPRLPTAPQSGAVLAISGGYYGVGGPGPLDNHGCVAGMEAADTRILAPRSEFVVVVLATACSPGSVLNTSGSYLRGLGQNASNLQLSCSGPDLRGNTAFISGLFPIRPGAAGTITAQLGYNGGTYTTQSKAALPVDQPA